MKKILLALLLLPLFVNGQYFNGPVTDSTTFTFATGDSLVHHMPNGLSNPSTIIIDTSATTLWQIGNTLKPVFSNTVSATHGIMTDTLQHYPAHANGFFVVKIYNSINCIIDFWHKYQTDSFHAGGMVEFSTDSATWVNIAACFGIATQNFYSKTDTIVSGQPSFMGNSNGEQLSRFELLNCVGIKTTATTCFPNYGLGPVAPIYLRFRFVSDSTIDSLSGWMIDSIRIDYTVCLPGGVNDVTNENSFSISPNPVYNELNITSTNKITNITITNLLGQTVFTHKYNSEQVQVSVADLPTGMYFVKINNIEVRRFVRE